MVFFDDILVYNQTLVEHKQHLRIVLETLKKHDLKAKLSKCKFGQPQVEYLGNIISGKGIATDPSKIAAIANWKVPVIGYYRRYIVGYAIICQPL